MKLRELIRDLSALAGAGMSEAEVEVIAFGRGGQVEHRRIVGAERGDARAATVVLAAVPYSAETEEGG